MHDIEELLSAYGFQVQLRRPMECKVRFRGRGTFLDVWYGKKGKTLGVYDPVDCRMRFYRRTDIISIEGIISKINYGTE